MNLGVKLVCLLSALAISLGSIFCVHEKFIDDYLMMLRGDKVLLAYNFRREEVNSTRRIFLLGGSNVREGYDQTKLSEWSSRFDYEVVKLGHSSSNTIEEQLILLDALKLRPYDHIFFTVAPTDLNNNGAPHMATQFETPLHYLDRVERQSIPLSIIELLEKTVGYFFEPYRYRELVSQAIKPRKTSDTPFNWRYRYLGKSHESSYFEEYIAKYSTNSLDFEMDVEFNQGRFEKLVAIKSKLSNNIHFYELPRNPLYDKIITPSYLASHYKKIDMLELLKIDKDVQFLQSDFYDFNHLNAEGRGKLTTFMLTYFEKNVLRVDRKPYDN